MGSLLQLVPALRIAIARHRRILAAVCASLAALLTLTLAFDSSSASEQQQSPASASLHLNANESAVPVLLADRHLADAVSPGDVVDLVQVTEEASAYVLTSHARVLNKGSAQSSLVSDNSTMLLVAVRSEDAVKVAAAGAQGSLTLVLTSVDN
ncbi:MAG: hypothetical protein WC005_10975 [Candidatus Nanopelagicales bacterium]